MIPEISGIRRLFVGKEVGLVLSVLLGGTLFIPGGFVPAYLAVLLASGMRNVYTENSASTPPHRGRG